MATITAVTVTITTPAGQVITLNTTDADQAALGVPSAVQGVSVGWSQSAVLAHQDAGRTTVVVFTPNPRAITWESLLEVTAQVDGRPAVLIGRGWVDQLSWRPYSTGYLVTVGAAGVISRAQATKLPAIVCPEEYASARVPRINTAAGWTVSTDLATPLDLAPLTIPEGTTAYDALAQIAGDLPQVGFPGIAVERAAGIGLATPSSKADSLSWPRYDGTDAYVTKRDDRLEVDAGAIGDADRQLDRAQAINTAKIAQPASYTDPTRPVTTYTDPATAGQSTAEVSLTRDLPAGAGPAVTGIRSMLHDLATCGPAVSLGTVPVVVRLLSALQLERAISMDTRGAQLLRILGGVPTDVDPLQIILAGTFTIKAPHLAPALTVTLASGRLAAIRPARFSDCPTVDGTFLRPRFSKMGTVRASETLPINSPDRTRAF